MFKKILFTLLFCIGFALTVSAADNTDIRNKTISVDNGCFYAISEDGVLFAFEKEGDNYKKTEILDNAVAVSRNYAIKEDGTLWTWSWKDGSCEQIMEDVASVDAAACNNHALILKKDGSLWYIGHNYGGYFYRKFKSLNDRELYPAPDKIMEDVKEAKNGADHCIVLKNDGTVLTFGNNSFGQCGIPEDNGRYGCWADDPIRVMDGCNAVFASGDASFAQKINKEVYAWGTNYVDTICNGRITDTPKFYIENIKDIENVSGLNFVIKEDDSLWAYGDIEDYRIPLLGFLAEPFELYENIDSVDAIDNYDNDYYLSTIMLDKDGVLWELKLDTIVRSCDELCDKEMISKNIRLSDTQVMNQLDDSIVISDWAIDEVKRANSAGLIPDNFGIDNYTQAIKRDKFCELALQLLKTAGMNPDVTGVNPFTDTSNDSVIILSNVGIINGKKDNIFAPDDNITREEAAAILYRMAEYMNIELPMIMNVVYYYDENQISDWAHDAVVAMREMLVMNGTSDYDFTPKGTYTVEQAIATMLRLYEY